MCIQFISSARAYTEQKQECQVPMCKQVLMLISFINEMLKNLRFYSAHWVYLSVDFVLHFFPFNTSIQLNFQHNFSNRIDTMLLACLCCCWWWCYYYCCFSLTTCSLSLFIRQKRWMSITWTITKSYISIHKWIKSWITDISYCACAVCVCVFVCAYESIKLIDSNESI